MDQEVRFCTAQDGVRIAYAIAGEGPPLVRAANFISHLEYDWQSPVWEHHLRLLAENHTLIRYDERGTGLSNWNAADLSFEAWVSDLEAVVDAAGLDRLPLYAMSQAGTVAVAYAARHPEKVSHLILLGAYARGWLNRGLSEEQLEEEKLLIAMMKIGWGRDNPAFRQFFTVALMPEGSKEQMDSLSELMRLSAEPEVAAQLEQEMHRTDVQDLASMITVPTLVLHARRDEGVPFDEGKLLASLIPNALFVALESRNHILIESEPAWQRFRSELRKFLGTEPGKQAPEKAPQKPERRLATILFTDIVGSTELAAARGDAVWLDILERHNALVREQISAYSGRIVQTTGDGFLILFDAPAQATRYAASIITAVRDLDIEIRCGLHIGEIEIAEDSIRGIGVHIAARVIGYADPSEILVTGTLKDAVVGSGIEFIKRATRTLKGVPGEWTLYSVAAAES